jgi:hypothetical protein
MIAPTKQTGTPSEPRNIHGAIRCTFKEAVTALIFAIGLLFFHLRAKGNEIQSAMRSSRTNRRMSSLRKAKGNSAAASPPDPPAMAAGPQVAVTSGHDYGPWPSLAVGAAVLPGCTSAGGTIAAAWSNVAEAVKLWLDDARADGEPIPLARSLAELLADREVRRDRLQ